MSSLFSPRRARFTILAVAFALTAGAERAEAVGSGFQKGLAVARRTRAQARQQPHINARTKRVVQPAHNHSQFGNGTSAMPQPNAVPGSRASLLLAGVRAASSKKPTPKRPAPTVTAEPASAPVVVAEPARSAPTPPPAATPQERWRAAGIVIVAGGQASFMLGRRPQLPAGSVVEATTWRGGAAYLFTRDAALVAAQKERAVSLSATVYSGAPLAVPVFSAAAQGWSALMSRLGDPKVTRVLVVQGDAGMPAGAVAAIDAQLQPAP